MLIIPISNPLLIGIYENDLLIQSYEVSGKTSDILPTVSKEIFSKYKIDRIDYVNGPGSYMAIKVAYIFLKTVSIVKKIDFRAVLGFELNNKSPIKALGKKYFKFEDEEIKIDFLKDKEIIEEFKLPKSLEELIFSNDTLPKYILPAVE